MNQGILLMGIDNCSGAAQSVVQVHWKALDNSFSNNFSLVQLKSIIEITKKVAHGYHNTGCGVFELGLQN